MTIWTYELEIFFAVIIGVAVDVINLQRNLASSWVPFRPAASLASLTIFLMDIADDVTRKGLRIPTPVAIDQALSPFLNIALVFCITLTVIVAILL